VEVDRDLLTGNKLINDYEILDELGRGQHGKVKLGRHVRTGQKVAIKIVQRYSKRRRLGKLGNPEDKVKKEVAILKKARHPNVVSLLEVIDDPHQQKVYIVLEYVENGEIVWRKKGSKEIVAADKRRLDREKRGIPDSPSFLEECQQLVRASQYCVPETEAKGVRLGCGRDSGLELRAWRSLRRRVWPRILELPPN
jgi:[calcium/calmodulin-dependent protein kinase] kinase